MFPDDDYDEFEWIFFLFQKMMDWDTKMKEWQNCKFSIRPQCFFEHAQKFTAVSKHLNLAENLNSFPVKKTAVVTSLKMIGKQANLSVALSTVRRTDSVGCLYIYFSYFCCPWSVELSILIQPKKINYFPVKKIGVVTSLTMIGKQANLSVALSTVRRPDSVSCLCIYF